LLGFSAVNTGNNLLFLVVSGLLAFMSVTGYAGMVNIQGLTPELLPPDEVFAGTPTHFRLRVNNSKRYLPSFLIRLERGGQAITLPLIGSGTSVEGSVALTFPDRGRVSIGRITLSSPFPVNFFTRYWKFDLDDSIIVFPRLLPGLPAGEGVEAERIGSNSRQSRGVDGELERIATYSGREPYRMIHWKLSARGDELLVKEFGHQATPPLIINPEELPGQNLEQRISRAAWLVRRWVQERPVGFRCGSRIIPAASGRRQGLKLLTELALYGQD